MSKRKRREEEDKSEDKSEDDNKLINDNDDSNPIKYKGVTMHQTSSMRKRFQAKFGLQYLGTFDTSKEAAEAYDHAAIQAGRPTSKLNFQNYTPKQLKYKGVRIRGQRYEAQLHIDGRYQSFGKLPQR